MGGARAVCAVRGGTVSPLLLLLTIAPFGLGRDLVYYEGASFVPVPALVAFLVAQRYVARGFALSRVKG